MPAYRSAAEAEVREVVVEHLRACRPRARIIHEINVCQGGCRVDVMAVDREEIVAVEIKSERDKLDRLPNQMAAMKSVAHHCVVALHEKFLVERETNVHAAHYERGGVHYREGLPDEPLRLDGEITWVFPQRQRALHPEHRPHRPVAILELDGAAAERAVLHRVDFATHLAQASAITTVTI